MGYLNQPCVQPGTYRQRINRSVRKVKDLFWPLLQFQIGEQEPDFRLTDLSSLTTGLSTVSKEAVEPITLITYIVQKKGVVAWVVLGKKHPQVHHLDRNTSDVEAWSWPVVNTQWITKKPRYCDQFHRMVTFYRQCLSWTNTPNSNSAMCFVVKESTLPWFHFFFWVQHQVPTFKPHCAVTDGAARI